MGFDPGLNGVTTCDVAAIKAFHLIQSAVEIDDPLGAGTLMQPVNILCDYSSKQARLFEFYQSSVAFIGLRCADARPAQRRPAPVALPFRPVRDKFVVLNRLAAQPCSLVVTVSGYA